jgi:AraC-like DNA-binding protein
MKLRIERLTRRSCFKVGGVARLLSQNWGPGSQMAYEAGFSNLSYFSKVLKEEFGVLSSEHEKAGHP